MTLNEELYFEITLKGVKSDLKKFIDFLKSGELDEFFEFSTDFISYDDRYAITEPDGETSVVLANEDYGIEIDEEVNAKALRQPNIIKLSTDASKVQVYLIPTNEELVIAQEAERLAKELAAK